MANASTRGQNTSEFMPFLPTNGAHAQPIGSLKLRVAFPAEVPMDRFVAVSHAFTRARHTSIVSLAAYRAGESLRDDSTGRRHNFEHEAARVMHAGIVRPENTDSITLCLRPPNALESCPACHARYTRRACTRNSGQPAGRTFPRGQGGDLADVRSGNRRPLPDARGSGCTPTTSLCRSTQLSCPLTHADAVRSPGRPR